MFVQSYRPGESSKAAQQLSLLGSWVQVLIRSEYRKLVCLHMTKVK